MEAATGSVRAIGADELEAWLALRPDDAVETRLRAAWESGSSGPERTFLLEEGGRPVGRVAYTADAVASALPDVHEATTSGLWVPWDEPRSAERGGMLVARSIALLRPPIGFVDGYANPAYMPDWAGRRAVFEAAGLPLFQEKEGFLWTSDVPTPAVEGRLTFRALPDVGRDALARTMGRCTAGTLDRQDQHYASLVGEPQWGVEMLAFVTPEDESSWLLAFDRANDVVGYVLLSTFDEPERGTIAHIGVLPEARGNGYVHELLAELDLLARRRGFTTILSDSDTLNAPMHAAFERAGHHAAATPWHVWHHRIDLRG